jgi:polysaccharide export outer membrane protein
MIQNPRYALHLGLVFKGGKKTQTVTSGDIFRLLFLFALTIWSAGCGNKFFDPTQIGRFRPVPAENIILDSLGVAEEKSLTPEGEEPLPIDVMVFETDYVFGPGDIVGISIYELLQENRMFTSQYIINETGKISIPVVGTVEVVGLTESQLEEEIRQILTPSILKDPSVTVILMNSQQHVYSILGDGIPQDGRYPIPRYDFRLTDALARAGGISSFNISYIYVSRAVTGEELKTEAIETEAVEQETTEQKQPELLIEDQQQMLEIIAPRAQRQQRENRLVITSAEMATAKELAEAALPEGFEPSTPGSGQTLTNDRPHPDGIEDLRQSSAKPDRETIDEPINSENAGRIEWIFQDGKWVPIQMGRPTRPDGVPPEDKAKPKKTIEPLSKKIPADLDWDQIGTAGIQRRVIKIPADSLISGDPRYNIVIRPGDTIHVPVDIIGEFCIMGNINRQGFIYLTGRPITLKMAIAAAGGLGPLAWPKRCEVTRRLDKNREETVMVDLEKIARGEQPDFFIKPNDLINVGTHPTARWRAVLRNAFRATYGFGFIYDRNFGDRDYGTSRPIPNWF